MKKSQKNETTTLDYLKTALPISAAIAVILVAAGFIFSKIVSDKIYRERWSDYDECGI